MTALTMLNSTDPGSWHIKNRSENFMCNQIGKDKVPNNVHVNCVNFWSARHLTSTQFSSSPLIWARNLLLFIIDLYMIWPQLNLFCFLSEKSYNTCSFGQIFFAIFPFSSVVYIAFWSALSNLDYLFLYIVFILVEFYLFC